MCVDSQRFSVCDARFADPPQSSDLEARTSKIRYHISECPKCGGFVVLWIRNNEEAYLSSQNIYPIFGRILWPIFGAEDRSWLAQTSKIRPQRSDLKAQNLKAQNLFRYVAKWGTGFMGTPSLPSKIVPTKICWLEMSGKLWTWELHAFKIRILLESNPPKSPSLVRGWAVPSLMGTWPSKEVHFGAERSEAVPELQGAPLLGAP